MRISRDVAGFDSAAATTGAVARFLRGGDFVALGQPAARLLYPVAAALNRLPVPARQWWYRTASGAEARPPERVAGLDLEQVAAGVVRCYPDRPYPAAVLGSSGGALVHLCAALGAPFLPQTLLLPVRQRGVDPDDPERAAHTFDATATALLAGNPHTVLHHMHDPNQDRLTLGRLAYFRVKRTRLGPAYERFLVRTLRPGAVLYLAECTRRWPTTRIGPRHVFQFGAVGGMEPDEYAEGSPRVADYLRRHGVARSRWTPPAPDGDSPEAEWGFDPALREDVCRFAARHGFRVRRLVYDDPEAPSPGVADLYRWWYGQRGLPTTRLLVESFVLCDPWWALRTACVPYWTTFSVTPSLRRLSGYLDRNAPFDLVAAMPFPHGVASVGLAGTADWAPLLARARVAGRFVAVSPDRFPADLGALFAVRRSLRALPGRFPLPEPLPPEAVEPFLPPDGAG